MEKFSFWLAPMPSGLQSRTEIFNWVHGSNTTATLRIEDDGRLFDTGSQSYIFLPAPAVRVSGYSEEFAVTCQDGSTHLGRRSNTGIALTQLDVPRPIRLVFDVNGLQCYNADGSHWLYKKGSELKLVPKPRFAKKK